jgi:hypothetical protein
MIPSARDKAKHRGIVTLAPVSLPHPSAGFPHDERRVGHESPLRELASPPSFPPAHWDSKQKVFRARFIFSGAFHSDLAQNAYGTKSLSRQPKVLWRKTKVSGTVFSKHCRPKRFVTPLFSSLALRVSSLGYQPEALARLILPQALMDCTGHRHRERVEEAEVGRGTIAAPSSSFHLARLAPN